MNKQRAIIVTAILALIWVVALAIVISSKEIKQGNEIDIYYQGKYIESWPLERFKTLVSTAEGYQKELLAEKNGFVKVVMKDDPWKLIANKVYKTKADIVWFSGSLAKGDYKELKVVTIDISLKNEVDDGIIAKVERVYGEIAKPGCVIFFGLFLLFVFI